MIFAGKWGERSFWVPSILIFYDISAKMLRCDILSKEITK